MYLNDTYRPRPVIFVVRVFEWGSSEDLVNFLYRVDTYGTDTPAERHRGQQVYTEPSGATTTRNCCEVKILATLLKKTTTKMTEQTGLSLEGGTELSEEETKHQLFKVKKDKQLLS